VGDVEQLRKTMAALLRRRSDVAFKRDQNGWVELPELAAAVGTQLERDVSVAELETAARRGPGPRFDIDRPRGRIRGASRRSRYTGPDILYHASTADQFERYRTQGMLTAGRNRRVFLSVSESHAWRVAHRFNRKPEVLFVDAGRARRSGVRFNRSRSGLYMSDPIPLKHVLNLRPGFRQQYSAGGILVRERDGGNELALVRCTRRSGTTWEIAKGKLEPGEDPAAAAIREVGEEMGIDSTLTVTQPLGLVRYGFQTPEGEPRLKSMYVYLMNADPVPEIFCPAEGEGICDVRWFPVHEACRRVTHPSLLQLVSHIRQRLG